MKISLSWLQDYIDLDLPAERISEILTAIGLEVEGSEEIESVQGGLRDIVVGHVLTCEKHPDADKLKVTTVDVGRAEPLQIVCGAPNVNTGQKVPVAIVGACIYTGPDESFQIKRSKIRGVESQGMICAADELGLESDHSGIMVLDEDAEVGTPGAQYFEVETDTIYDIGLTPNRSDATSHMGVARDLHAYLSVHHDYKQPLRIPSTETSKAAQSTSISVEIKTPEACPRLSAAALGKVKVGESPAWLRRRLESIGVRSINNIVDITNYILHDMGQPLHAYDMTQVADRQLRVKFLSENSKFTTLDGVERSLASTDLMICDGADKPLCMAGVFGGEGSGVTESTTDIFLESAHFDAQTIRRTSMSHFLRTDAAQVFEKGSDPTITRRALERAIALMGELAGAQLASYIIDHTPVELKPVTCQVRWSRIDLLIGNKIPQETTKTILKALGFKLLGESPTALTVEVPASHADVLREVDVIEEILRIYGFNQIEISSTSNYALIPTEYPSNHYLREQVSQLLTARGMAEMMGMSLTTADRADICEINDQLVHINNTSNVDLSIMRPSVIVSGLESIKNNINRRQLELRLYEYGRSYRQSDAGYDEQESLCIYVTGQSDTHWIEGQQATDFYELKSHVDAVLRRLGIRSYQQSESDHSLLDYGLHYHRGPRSMVHLGRVSREATRSLGIDQEVYVAELSWETVRAFAQKSEINIVAPSKYPASRRDLALMLPERVQFEEIRSLSMKAGKPYVTDVSLFDVYAPEDMKAQGQKSYAIQLTFQSADKTLKDKEIDKAIQKITSTLQAKLGAEIRK